MGRGLPEYIDNKSTPGGNYTDSGMSDDEARDRLDEQREYVTYQYDEGDGGHTNGAPPIFANEQLMLLGGVATLAGLYLLLGGEI